MWNAIQTDPDYGSVKNIWEEKTKDPNFQYQLQSGLVNPLKEFNDTVREYHKGMLKRALNTINQLQGKGPISAPHIEGGERVPQNLVTETAPPSDVEKIMKEKREKASKAMLSEEDELSLVDTLFMPPKASEE